MNDLGAAVKSEKLLRSFEINFPCKTEVVIEFEVVFFRNFALGDGLSRGVRPDSFEVDQVWFIVLVKILVFAGCQVIAPTEDVSCYISDRVLFCDSIGENA